MRRLATLLAVLTTVALGACGGDDADPAGSAEEGGVSAAEGPTGDAAVTAKRFNELSIPDELKLIEDLVAANPDACAGIDPSRDAFRQAVFINAVQAPPDTLISELVLDACEG